MYAFKHILVPTDLSKCARKALGLAITFAIRCDADLYLLVVEDNRPGSKTWQHNETANEEIGILESLEQQTLDSYLSVAREVAEETGLPQMSRDRLHIRVSTGEPAAKIIAAAEDAQVDLIVMGTHGRTSIKDFFVGSTTERVVLRATCNVLTVKPEGYPYLRD
jgi:nucleotide-binding universal stress UspA family protein